MALAFVDLERDPSQIRDFVQYVSLLRVGLPSLALAASVQLSYPTMSMMVADLINDTRVFTVVSQFNNCLFVCFGDTS
jgi:hypothetical protein